MRKPNRNPLLTLFLAGLIATASMMQASGQESGDKPAEVQDLGFNYQTGKSRLEITFDKEVTFEKNVVDADKQVIIDVKNARIKKKFARRIDTSQHKSNISLVSPYQSGDVVRIALQLKENGGVEVSQDGKRLIAEIDNKQAAGSKEEVSPAPAAAETTTQSEPAPAEAASAASPVAAPAASTAEAETSSASASTAGSKSNDTLDRFLEAQKSKTYVGQRIDLQVQDRDISEVFRIISEASEFNIILSDNVKGKVVLNLSDVPWDQALDLLLTSYRLAAERHGNVLRIVPLEVMTRDREAEAAAVKAVEAAEPLVVKIFPISYAKTSSLQAIIRDFLSKDSSVVQGPQSQGPALRGSIQVDARTNALIVRDTPTTIEKIKRIIKELDTQTPQVLIEAKFVEVNEGYSKNVNGRIFSSTRELGSSGSLAFTNSKNNYGMLFGGSGASLGTGFAITDVTGGASIGFAPKVGLLPGIGEIGAFLSIIEGEDHGKVIASPRVVAQNGNVAEISQGKSIQLATSPGANASGGFTTIQATLSLSVTPQVTNDGSIILDLTFKQDTPPASLTGNFAIDTKSVKSNVIVESGGTLVIGGIYSSRETEASSGLPILRDLPILGPFFGSKSKDSTKNELFIFITPRVLNEKESGIKG